MAGSRIELIGLSGFPVVKQGDDLCDLVCARAAADGLVLGQGDVVILAQKIVSKSEGRLVRLSDVVVSRKAVELAAIVQKDPRLVELILQQSRRVVRASPGVLIVEHRLGLIMANAGIDHSNVAESGDGACVLLLPEDPDGSALRLRAALRARIGADVAVVINDSFGRPWRQGTVGVAIGAAGLPALDDRRGKPDLFGRRLEVTVVGLADEIAAAASMVMGQADEGRPVVVVRGMTLPPGDLAAARICRPPAEDLFR